MEPSPLSRIEWARRLHARSHQPRRSRPGVPMGATGTRSRLSQNGSGRNDDGVGRPRCTSPTRGIFAPRRGAMGPTCGPEEAVCLSVRPLGPQLYLSMHRDLIGGVPAPACAPARVLVRRLGRSCSSNRTPGLRIHPRGPTRGIADRASAPGDSCFWRVARQTSSTVARPAFRVGACTRSQRGRCDSLCPKAAARGPVATSPSWLLVVRSDGRGDPERTNPVPRCSAYRAQPENPRRLARQHLPHAQLRDTVSRQLGGVLNWSTGSYGGSDRGLHQRLGRARRSAWSRSDCGAGGPRRARHAHKIG